MILMLFPLFEREGINIYICNEGGEFKGESLKWSSRVKSLKGDRVKSMEGESQGKGVSELRKD